MSCTSWHKTNTQFVGWRDELTSNLQPCAFCPTLSISVLLHTSHFTTLISPSGSSSSASAFKSLSSQNPQPLSNGLPRTNHSVSGGPVWSPALFLLLWGRALSFCCLFPHSLLKLFHVSFVYFFQLSWFWIQDAPRSPNLWPSEAWIMSCSYYPSLVFKKNPHPLLMCNCWLR